MTAVVIIAALSRLIGGAPHVQGLPVIVVSLIAGAVMVACAFIIGSVEVESEDLNMRSVMLGRLLGSVRLDDLPR